MTGTHFDTLSARFQRIARDASDNTAMLRWPDRLFFLVAAGEKHEAWRRAYALAYLDEPVPAWPDVVSAVIELWGPGAITCFEMAAVYTISGDRDWRAAGEAWCAASGRLAQLAAFQADPVGHAGRLVGKALEDAHGPAG